MNKRRRKAIEKLLERLDGIGLDVEQLRDEEQDAYDAMPESLQQAPRGEQMLAAIDGLSDAFDAVESARDLLGDAVAA